MAGSDHSGQDMESGRVNRAEHQTQIWAQEKDGKAFPGKAILIVAPAENIEDSGFHIPNARLDAVVGRGSHLGAGVKGHGGLVGVLGKGENGPGVEGHGAPPGSPRATDGTLAEQFMDVPYSAGVLGLGGGLKKGRPHGPGVFGLGGYIPDEDKGTQLEGWPEESIEQLPRHVDLFGDAGVAGQGSPGGPDPHKPGPGIVGLGGILPGSAVGGIGVVGVSRPSLVEDGAYQPSTNTDTGVYGDGPTGIVAQGRKAPVSRLMVAAATRP